MRMRVRCVPWRDVMDKKGGAPIPIVLLVVGIIVVMSATWFIFLTKDNESAIRLQSVEVVEHTRARELAINSQVRWIMEDVADRMRTSESSEDFIQFFREEIVVRDLVRYYPEFVFIDTQLVPENIEITLTELRLRLNIKLEGSGSDDDLEIAHVVRAYEKEFVIER